MESDAKNANPEGGRLPDWPDENLVTCMIVSLRDQDSEKSKPETVATSNSGAVPEYTDSPGQLESEGSLIIDESMDSFESSNQTAITKPKPMDICEKNEFCECFLMEQNVSSDEPVPMELSPSVPTEPTNKPNTTTPIAPTHSSVPAPTESNQSNTPASNEPVPDLVEIDPAPELLLNPDKRKKPSAVKVIIRRLPPDMTQEEFLTQVTPLPDYLGFYYVAGDPRASPTTYSRAYFSFLNLVDVYGFKEKFDNYVFVDSKGIEFPAVVEYAPFQRIPKQLPPPARRDAKCGTIESDPVFAKFKAEYTQEASDNTESKPEYSFQIKEDSKKTSFVSTPLVEFINSRRGERNRRDERREERRKREDIKKRVKEDERRQRRAATRESVDVKYETKQKDNQADGSLGEASGIEFVKPQPSTSGERKRSGSHRFETSYKSGYRSGGRESEKQGRNYKNEQGGKSSDFGRSGAFDSGHGDKKFKHPGRYQAEKIRPSRESYQEKLKHKKIGKVVYYSYTGAGKSSPKVKQEMKSASESSVASESQPERPKARIDEDEPSSKSGKIDADKSSSSRTVGPEETASDRTKTEENASSIKEPESSNRQESRGPPATAAIVVEANSKTSVEKPKIEGTAKGKPSSKSASEVKTKTNSDRLQDDPRKQRRIKNKDRPAMAIYRPGMGRFSKERKSGESSSAPTEDSSKPGPSSKDSSKPGPSSKDSSKPGSSQDSSKPGTSQDSSKPGTSQDSSKPGPSKN